MTQHSLAMTDINRWFPSTYHRGPNWMVWLALMACFCTVFIKIWTPTSVNRWPEAVSTLLFIYPLVRQWRLLKEQRFIVLWGVTAAASFIFFGINYLFDPESATKYAEFEILPRIYLFIPIAWWLGGNNRTIALFLIISLLGFFFACLQDPNFDDTILRILAGGRVSFGILNAQHVAMFFSIGLVGCLSYLNTALKIQHWRNSIKYTPLLLGCAALCVAGIIATQTRAAFFGLTVAFVILIILLVRKSLRKEKKKLSKQGVVALVLTIALLGIFTINLNKTLIKRESNEKTAVAAAISGDWGNIPYTSIGIRLNTWLQALEWIAKKPLIGYGGDVRRDIIQKSPKHPEWVKETVGHFHNSYIEITLGFGLIGLLLALAPLAYGVSKGASSDQPAHVFSFFALIIFIVMNLFESYLFFWMGPYILTILIAPLVSVAFNKYF
jgi:O-antigen ligase